MKNLLLAIAFFCLFAISIFAQKTFTLLDPVITIDFGNGRNAPELNISKTLHYERVYEGCPDDGFYSYTNHTESCFNNDWFTLNSDHSGGGNMMLVNASPAGGEFFSTTLKELKPSTTYQFAAYLMNVCRINGGCSPLPPKIAISISTPAGEEIAVFKTGSLAQGSSPNWKKYAGFFTTTAAATDYVLKMSNLTTGNCGNDFALDDITLRERIEEIKEPDEKPDVNTIQKTTSVRNDSVVQKPLRKPRPLPDTVMVSQRVMSSKPEAIINAGNKKELPAVAPVPGANTFSKFPDLIATRDNPVVKTITVGAGDIQIDIYDNGLVDGDTVTIYHNNELVVSRAALGAKPISFTLKADAQNPHHEIVMVANNLGSIPPNTSLMMVHANGKRYEVFISSSEHQNAKVVIDFSPPGIR